MEIELDTENQREIMAILNKNKIDDLKKFLTQRSCINNSNQYLTYLFHAVQSAGILTVSIGQAYSNEFIVWIGVGLNTLASVLHIVTADNKKISKTLLGNLKKIKEGSYLDEAIVDTEEEAKSLSGGDGSIILRPLSKEHTAV
jgi:hypothetical protein